MPGTAAQIEEYFKVVIQGYNYEDIKSLLDAKYPKAGPLLNCVVNGIDTVGGSAYGFTTGSRKRSVDFVTNYLRLNSTIANLLYCVMRCGISHEGVTKLGTMFFVEYSRVKPGVYLYKNTSTNTVYLDVTELARRYMEAIDNISTNISQHLHHIPDRTANDEQLLKDSLNTLSDDFRDFEAAVAGGYTSSSTPPPTPVVGASGWKGYP